MAKHLDSVGVQHLWSKVKSALGDKVDKVTGKGLSTNDYTTAEKNKLNGIEDGAQANQNAFSNVKVGSTTIAADSATDVLELVAGTDIKLTPDATSDKITIGVAGGSSFKSVKIFNENATQPSEQWTEITADINDGSLKIYPGEGVTIDADSESLTFDIASITNAELDAICV